MSESKSDSLNWILGAALLLIAAFVLGAIVMSNSQAYNPPAGDDVATDVNVDNTAPTIQVSLGNSTTPGVQSNNFDSSGITINTGRDAETQVRVGITVSDLNGVADFRNIKWQFSKSGSTCDSEADMNANADGSNSGKHTCFYDENVSGILSSTGASDYGGLSDGTTAGTPTTTAQYYVTTLNLPSYIGSTDASGQYPVDTWTLTATVTDGNGSTDSATVSAEVNTSSEVAFEKTFTFPESIALNAETTVSQNVEHGFEAISNANNSIEVSSSSDFTCDVSGGFARANLRHGLNNTGYSTADASKAITSASVDTDLNLGYRNSAAIVNKNLYWNIRIDDDSVNGEGAAGNCSNTLTALTTHVGGGASSGGGGLVTSAGLSSYDGYQVGAVWDLSVDLPAINGTIVSTVNPFTGSTINGLPGYYVDIISGVIHRVELGSITNFLPIDREYRAISDGIEGVRLLLGPEEGSTVSNVNVIGYFAHENQYVPGGMDLFVYSSIWTNLWTNQTYTADGMWPAGFYVSSQGDSMTLNAARNVIVSDVYPGDILNTDNLMTALGSTDPNYLATSLVTGFNGLADPYGNPGWTQASSGPDYDAYTGTYKHLETGEIHVLHSGSPTYMRSGVYLDFSNGSIINFHSDDYYMIVTPIN